MNKLMLVIPALAMLVMALGLVQASEYTVTVNAQVAPYLQVTPNYNVVNFRTLYPGTTNNPAPGQEQGIYNYTVNTNANYKVSIYGTDFSGTAGDFSISNLKFAATDNLENLNTVDRITLTNSAQDYPVTFSSNTLYHGYWLSIPALARAGSYSATVYIDIQNV